MRHIFIINPFSGSHHSTDLIPMIQTYFETHEGEFDIHLTQAAGHAKTLAQTISQADSTIYVLAGDGTANEVLNGLQPNVAMAIIPRGTGNDFFRMLRLPELSLKDLLTQTIEGKVVKVDYALANDQRFINCFSMGFDADIGLIADKIKKRQPWLSSLAYGLATMMKLLDRKNQPMTLRFNQHQIQTNSLMIAVMNGQFYGGGFMPTPQASIQDGQLDVCVVENTHLLNVLRVLPKYLKGTHTQEKIVKFYKVRELLLESPTLLNAQTDGESLRSASVHFKIVAGGLLLRVPQSSTLEASV